MAYAAAMSNLQSQLETLASDLVTSLISALRVAPIDEIIDLAAISADGAAPSARPRRTAAAPKVQPRRAAPAAAAKPTAGRRHRASAAEVQAQKKVALDTAKMLKPGFSKGEVMDRSGSKIDLGRALTLLVQEGKLRKQGERRMTRYWMK
jgi:hypothetical protein